MPSGPFDFIVVGAGLTGSGVAARLAEKAPGSTVLLIEGGDNEMKTPPNYFDWGTLNFKKWPGKWHAHSAVDVPGDYNAMNCWDPSAGACANWTWPPEYTAGAYQVRIKGGGGSVNGALHQYPQPNMFDGGRYGVSGWPSWPKGWQEADMQPFFQEVESMFQITTTPSSDGKHYLDRTGGNQIREVLAQPCDSCAAYSEGLKNASVMMPAQGKMGVPFVIAKDGHRQSTANVLLPKAELLPNFKLLLQSEVTEVVHSDGRATAVKLTRENIEHTIELSEKGVLVMCAGALNTPRLLLKSGITNAGMGKNLSDHPMTIQTYQLSSQWDVEPFPLNPPSDHAISKEIAFHSGGLSQFGPTLTAFLRAPGTPGNDDDFDIEIFVNPASSRKQLQVYFLLMRPTCSSANLTYQDGKLTRGPGISFACQRDVDTMQFAQDFVQQRMSKQLKRAECVENCGSVTDTRILSVNHWGGSCAFGRCVDPRTLIVYGTRNIAVADASLLPGQVWSHPALILEAMALKAGDMLAEKAKK